VTQSADYFVAPFSFDGELIGVAGRSVATLSPRWLDFCRRLLGELGPVFRRAIPLPPLEHITLQFTTNDSAALVSFYVREQPATSAVALRGKRPGAEAEVLRMFVESLRRVPVVQQAAGSAAPFEAAFGLSQRPLYVVVLWANPQIRDADLELVQELDNHLAAAFLSSPAPQ